MSDNSHYRIRLEQSLPKHEIVVFLVRAIELSGGAVLQSPDGDIIVEGKLEEDPVTGQTMDATVTLSELRKMNRFFDRYRVRAFSLGSLASRDDFRQTDVTFSLGSYEDGPGAEVISCDRYFMWEPFANYDCERVHDNRPQWEVESAKHLHELHLQWQPEAAHVYYQMRCAARGLRARLVGAYYDIGARNPGYPSLFSWRPGRRSYVIPKFEEYCEHLGYAAMEDLSLPVTPAPPYVPTGPLHYELQKLEDWR